MTPMRRAFLLMALTVAPLVGCGGSAPTAEQRTVTDRARGYSFVLAPGWLIFDNEARSPGGSLLTIQAYSLEGADPEFRAGLPETVVPQLEAWSLYYFSVVGKPTKGTTTLGGEPALAIAYPVRVRPTDPQQKAEYWVVRNGKILYLIRATYPPGLDEKDGNSAREMLSSLRFLPGGATSPLAPPLPKAAK